VTDTIRGWAPPRKRPAAESAPAESDRVASVLPQQLPGDVEKAVLGAEACDSSRWRARLARSAVIVGRSPDRTVAVEDLSTVWGA
jgi:hypothetical protein